MAVSDKSFEPIQARANPNQKQKYSQNHDFAQFLAYIDMLSIKKHVLKLENSTFW